MTDSALAWLLARSTGYTTLFRNILLLFSHARHLVIDVYGVYTHAQIDRQVWDRISRDLYSRHGPEYRKRFPYSLSSVPFTS